MIVRAALPESALLGLHAEFPDRYPALLESVAGGLPLGRPELVLNGKERAEHAVLVDLERNTLLRALEGRE